MNFFRRERWDECLLEWVGMDGDSQKLALNQGGACALCQVAINSVPWLLSWG